MYTPSILDTPLLTTGPIDAHRPNESVTADWPLLDDGQVQIGIWECTPGRFTGRTGAENESMFMVAGSATVEHDEGALELTAGTLWTTPRDWANTWTVHQTVRKMYVIDQRPSTPGSAAHVVDTGSVQLGAATPRAGAIAGTPHESATSLWTHDGLDVGLWECTPGEFPFQRDGYDEVFCVISGRATMVVDGPYGPGQSFELVPGSVILTPAGLTGRWIVHETIRKAYTIIHR